MAGLRATWTVSSRRCCDKFAATQLEHSGEPRSAASSRSQRIEKQLEDYFIMRGFEQMKQGATYDDLFSELVLENSGEREAEMTWFVRYLPSA